MEERNSVSREKIMCPLFRKQRPGKCIVERLVTYRKKEQDNKGR